MARARRTPPRPPARRGQAEFQRALRLPPQINGYGVEIQSPAMGYHSRDKRPDITVVPRASVAMVADVQVEWRTQMAYQAGLNPLPSAPWLPTPTYVSTALDQPRNTPVVLEPPTDLSYTTWWYRVRVGDIDANVWSAWSEQRFLDVYPILGQASEYIEMNVGVVAPDKLDQTAIYIEMNVGAETVTHPQLMRYVAMNVGVESKVKLSAEYMPMNVYPPTGEYQAAAYTDLNMVTDQTPQPHIWWIRPEQGKEGYVFNIYGHGFGPSRGSYDGKVRLGNYECAIARWEVIPASPRSGVVTAEGTPKLSGVPTDTSYFTNLPRLRVRNDISYVLQVGDVIEFDIMSDNELQFIFPSFDVSGTGFPPSSYATSYWLARTSLTDQDNHGWDSVWNNFVPNVWKTRRFTIPANTTYTEMAGKTISNFDLRWYYIDPLARSNKVSVRRWRIIPANGSAPIWITGDDEMSVPLMTYTAVGGSILHDASYDRTGHVIDHGSGLDPDTITPEHGWIVAIVPTGAVSADVHVVLEDD